MGSAPIPNRPNFRFWDMKELEELLMFFWSRGLKLSVPPVHVTFGKSGSTHNFNPFFVGDHCLFPELTASLKQSPDCTLMLPQMLYFFAELNESLLQDPCKIVIRLVENPTDIIKRQPCRTITRNLLQFLQIPVAIHPVIRLRPPGRPHKPDGLVIQNAASVYTRGTGKSGDGHRPILNFEP
jgi:hypothetical protein